MFLILIIAVKYDNYLNCNKPFAVIDYYLKTKNMSIYIEISTRIQQIDKDSIMYIILQFLNLNRFSRLWVFVLVYFLTYQIFRVIKVSLS